MIFTFYSYKGGVGRSMALANVAQWFYEQGLRVVMIDWDLEAPGLENFFYNSPEDLELVRSKLGLIDMLTSYKRIFPRLNLPERQPNGTSEVSDIAETETSDTGSESEDAEGERVAPNQEYPIDWSILLRENLAPISDSLYPIHAPNPDSEQKDAGLWLIPAGWRSGDRFSAYAQAVQSFDWSDFYDSYQGEAYFDWMRAELVREDLADVVLIDSRTGVTEMGGVCTRQMADLVVSFVVPNAQNLAGVYTMTQSFSRAEIAEKRQRTLEMVIVPSRLDISEVDDRKAFEDQFRATLDSLTPSAFNSVGSSFWDLQIQYVPKYAYRERLAINDSRVPELEKAYKKLTVHLALLAQGESGERIRVKCANELQREFASHLPGLYQLTEEERARYLQLAFFPENLPIPLRDAAELWELDAPAAEKLLHRLAAISLVRYHSAKQEIELNSVLREQLLEQMPDDDALNDKVEAAFARFSKDEQKAARHILTRLVRLVAADEDGHDTRQRVKLSELDQPMVSKMAEAKLVTIERDQASGAQVVQIANEAYLRGWRRLRDWRTSDREFLLWRQQLKSKIVEWEGTKHDQGALLSGAPLALAISWRERRPDELNESEKKYIEESVTQSERVVHTREEWISSQRRSRRIAAAVFLILLIVPAILVIKYVRQRRAEEQQQQLREAARLKAEAANNSGSVELENRNYDAAIAYFNEAIAAQPNYADAYLNRARAYNRRGDEERAIADYSQAIQISLDPAVAYFERGSIYAFGGKEVERAIADFTSAIKVKPDYWNAYLRRAALYLGADNYDGAIDDYTSVIQSASEQLIPTAYFYRAHAYKEKRYTDHARDDFLKALALTADPDIRLQADFFLKEIRYRPPLPDPVPATPNIFLLYTEANDSPAVEAISASLQKNGLRVQHKDQYSGFGRVGVLYYSPRNRELGELILKIVTDTIATQSKSGREPKFRLIYAGDSSPYVPRETIDIWIPSLQKALQPLRAEPASAGAAPRSFP